MRIIFIILTILFFGLSNNFIAQEDDTPTKHFIYAEIGGPATIASMNYEYIFLTKGKFSWSGRIGIGSSGFKDFERNFNPDIYLPIGLNAHYLFYTGEKSSLSAEVGFGNTFSSVVYADYQNNVQRELANHGYLSTGIGWYFHRGFFTRLYYTPILENYNSFRHWGSLSIGYSF